MNFPAESHNFASSVCLCIEASADSASACIVKDNISISEAISPARHGHSETLIGLIEQVISDSGCSADQIDMIIAGCGPGSFTGLRVCLATAHGYQLATNAQAAGISALVALAASCLEGDDSHADRIISFCDSRRNSLFMQVFDSDLAALSQIEDIRSDDVADWLANWQTDGLSAILAGDTGLLPQAVSQTYPCRHLLTTARLLAAMLISDAVYLDSHPEYRLPLIPLYVHPAFVTQK